ncbi:MAG: hypothetical protein WB699_08880 [Bacteroidota bacterium]
MKTRMMLFAIVAASSLAFAQENSSQNHASYFTIDRGPGTVPFKTAVVNLVWCLSMDNEGVVESAMSHFVRLRVVHPQLSLPMADKAIKRLIFEGKTPAVRYEAYLANAVIENPGMISVSACNPDWSPEMLFSVIAEKLQNSSFGNASPGLSAYKH